eukprot:1149386-Pelagomonas_calceolata.AAC.4
MSAGICLFPGLAEVVGLFHLPISALLTPTLLDPALLSLLRFLHERHGGKALGRVANIYAIDLVILSLFDPSIWIQWGGNLQPGHLAVM